MVGAAQESVAATGNSPPPFLSKTYDMVDDPSTDAVVSWSDNSNSFVVWNVPDFSRDVLPKFFKHNNFSSFVRQLNTYGFRKVDPDRYEFANEGFLRGQKHLLKNITRRKSTHAQSHPQPSQIPSTSVGSCVEVGKFGLEEDVEMLKRDKNVLMQELVRLRQQQQATDNQLQTVGQRVHIMEQRQQQMMSFLAKAMQSPGFVAQLVNQPNDGNRRISGVNKKRRLHNPGEENLVRNQGIPSPNGQVVKYQPLMNEAAKAVLRQILKINASGRLEKKINNTNGFLIDKMRSSNNALDIGNSSSWLSGVTLSEVLPTSSQPHLAMESGLLCDRPLAAISSVQSSPSTVSQEATFSQIPEINSLSSQDKAASCKFSCAQVPENDIGLPDMSLEASKIGNMESEDMMAGFADGVLPVVSEGVSSDPDVDVLLDDMPKLPGINDVFWEQFLAASPLHGDTDEINSSMLGFGVEKEQDLQLEQENEWDKMKHMHHLTEQMGLLAAGSKQV